MYPMFIAALFKTARNGSNLDVHQQMMGKAAVVHIFNGIILSHEKEHI